MTLRPIFEVCVGEKGYERGVPREGGLVAPIGYIATCLGLARCNISTRFLCFIRAMSLLLGNVVPNNIRLIGHWRSDGMLLYCHVMAKPLMHGYTVILVAKIDCTLILTASLLS